MPNQFLGHKDYDVAAHSNEAFQAVCTSDKKSINPNKPKWLKT